MQQLNKTINLKMLPENIGYFKGSRGGFALSLPSDDLDDLYWYRQSSNMRRTLVDNKTKLLITQM